ncbi:MULTISPECIES: FmdE family protein [unclassified Methanoculleus]|uniref:FmdE family protein n=1 Tax=unclassified Methanoculleus TaxID=2619537 RepID=UPI0025F86E4A|nr:MULTISPECIES: FmdE family protein [unclassified Methanoculleus]MCK9318520.1 FmdE family protein [Methanoculleus sp.]MDD2254361.1 FmdE family protein [Methanoculleus sp.]MDD2787017.1 FmdE family protein [Methanoculleus sp.]MDD3215191.1 FmdE family protein [Methanoculleus sp.]MDD4314913.1 FmdE family protein [Methanoculleus sp.]
MSTITSPGTPGEGHGRFAEAAAFHGHVCPGLALGYRAAETALERLRSGRAEDEELVTIAETDACGVDAIQVLTGCTAGKGNLFFKDYGKHAFTFINRRTGDAVRVAANPSFNIDSLDPGLAPLRARVMQGRASDKEHAEFHERTGRIVEALLHMPAEELFSIQNVDVEIPERARIFRSVPCAKCGEMTAESRVRVEDGELVCYACSTEYSRRG